MYTHLIPILAKTSSHWNDFPWPLPPHTPKIRGTCSKFFKHPNQLTNIYNLPRRIGVFDQNLTNLNVWQVQKVLSNVNNKFVHESWSNVVAIHNVVQSEKKHETLTILWLYMGSSSYENLTLKTWRVYLLAKTSADVIIGAHDCIVGPATHRGLEESVHHALSSGDVLLVIWTVKGKPSPPVFWGLLFLIIFCRNLEIPRWNLWVSDLGGGLLQAVA